MLRGANVEIDQLVPAAARAPPSGRGPPGGEISWIVTNLPLRGRGHFPAGIWTLSVVTRSGRSRVAARRRGERRHAILAWTWSGARRHLRTGFFRGVPVSARRRSSWLVTQERVSGTRSAQSAGNGWCRSRPIKGERN